jgi:hypothetical protein
LHRLAGLAARARVELVEHLLEALDLAPGFLAVMLEGLAQLVGLGRLGHFGERLHQLLLGVIDVPELVDQQILH